MSTTMNRYINVIFYCLYEYIMYIINISNKIYTRLKIIHCRVHGHLSAIDFCRLESFITQMQMFVVQ